MIAVCVQEYGEAFEVIRTAKHRTCQQHNNIIIITIKIITYVLII